MFTQRCCAVFCQQRLSWQNQHRAWAKCFTSYNEAGGIMRMCGSADVTTCKMRMLMRIKIRILPTCAYWSKHKFDLDSVLKLPVLLWLSNELHWSCCFAFFFPHYTHVPALYSRIFPPALYPFSFPHSRIPAFYPTPQYEGKISLCKLIRVFNDMQSLSSNRLSLLMVYNSFSQRTKLQWKCN